MGAEEGLQIFSFSPGRFPSHNACVTTPPSEPVPPRPARSPLPFVLSGIMVLIYFGFILLVAYRKALLGTQIVPGISWGILLGALVIVSAWVLTWVYVLVSNRKAGK